MEEPGVLIRWVIFLFAGGDAGRLAVIATGSLVLMLLLPRKMPQLRPKVVGALFVMGGVFTLCSPPPLSAGYMVVSALWLTIIMWSLRTRGDAVTASPEAGFPNSPRGLRRTILLLGSQVWLLSGIMPEIPHLVFPPRPIEINELLVIGDSVTAGLNDGEDTWPRKLARESRVKVHDASQPGATLKSARTQNEQLADEDGLVVLEIGGNDMLEGLPVETFERDLDQLLTEVTRSGRSIVMLELPLPPFSGGYGLAQRRQAQRHRVSLIPKRQFTSILTTGGATVDGIHLSDRGQAILCGWIRSLFGDQLKSGSGSYHRHESRHRGPVSAN